MGGGGSEANKGSYIFKIVMQAETSAVWQLPLWVMRMLHDTQLQTHTYTPACPPTHVYLVFLMECIYVCMYVDLIIVNID